jgi:hypothetical protein
VGAVAEKSYSPYPGHSQVVFTARMQRPLVKKIFNRLEFLVSGGYPDSCPPVLKEKRLRPKDNGVLAFDVRKNGMLLASLRSTCLMPMQGRRARTRVFASTSRQKPIVPTRQPVAWLHGLWGGGILS